MRTKEMFKILLMTHIIRSNIVHGFAEKIDKKYLYIHKPTLKIKARK